MCIEMLMVAGGESLELAAGMRGQHRFKRRFLFEFWELKINDRSNYTHELHYITKLENHHLHATIQ